jgi:hypothetical protein
VRRAGKSAPLGALIQKYTTGRRFTQAAGISPAGHRRLLFKGGKSSKNLKNF